MNMRTLSLVKRGHKYVFRYAAGCEHQIIDEVSRLAEDDASPVDWLDAATLSFQVAHEAAAECTRTLERLPQPSP